MWNVSQQSLTREWQQICPCQSYHPSLSCWEGTRWSPLAREEYHLTRIGLQTSPRICWRSSKLSPLSTNLLCLSLLSASPTPFRRWPSHRKARPLARQIGRAKEYFSSFSSSNLRTKTFWKLELAASSQSFAKVICRAGGRGVMKA